MIDPKPELITFRLPRPRDALASLCALLAVSAAALAVSAGAARAADAIVEQPPEPPAPQYAPTGDWTGPYLGLYGAYDWLNADVSPGADLDSIHGPLGGAYLGYNQQLDSNWVGGVEILGGFSGAEETNGGLKLEQNWEGSLRGRLGQAFDNSYMYGLAGVAVSGFEGKSGGKSDDQVSLGWTIGAGFETRVTDNITGRIEYNFSDYGSQDFSVGGGKRDIDIDGHTVKLGVGFHF